MKRHLRITVAGAVQGVWFRQSTKAEAGKLNLNGTVCNMSDGTVEIHAEGEENSLEELLGWCRKGPQHADVNNVSYSELPIKGYREFLVI